MSPRRLSPDSAVLSASTRLQRARCSTALRASDRPYKGLQVTANHSSGHQLYPAGWLFGRVMSHPCDDVVVELEPVLATQVPIGSDEREVMASVHIPRVDQDRVEQVLVGSRAITLRTLTLTVRTHGHHNVRPAPSEQGFTRDSQIQRPHTIHQQMHEQEQQQQQKKDEEEMDEGQNNVIRERCRESRLRHSSR